MPIYKDPSDNTSSPEVRYGGRTGHAGHAEQLDPQLTYDNNNLLVPSYQLHDLPKVSGPLVRTGGPIGAYAHVELGEPTISPPPPPPPPPVPTGTQFTTLIAGASQYYSIPPIVCTGDCKVTALVYFTGDEIVIVGNRDSEGGLLVLATGALQWRPVAGGGEVHSHAGDVPVNRLSIITADRTGDDGHMTVNTLTVFDHKVSTNDFTINAIGTTGGEPPNQESFSTGIIANVLLEAGGVPVRSYKLDEDRALTTVVKNDLTSTTEGDGVAVNLNASLGAFTTNAELDWLSADYITDLLWPNPVTAGNEWSLADDEWSLVGSGGFNELQHVFNSETPPVVRLEGELVAISGAGFDGGGGLNIAANGPVLRDVGEYSVDVEQSTNGAQFFNATGGVVNATLSRYTYQQLLQLGLPHPLTERWFTRLTAGASQHYTIPTVTLTGDFEIAISLLTDSEDFQYLLGGASGFSNYLGYRGNSNRLELKMGGGAVLNFTISALHGGKLNRFTLRRVSGVVTVLVDETVYPENIAATNNNTFPVSRIGQNNNSSHFNGILADVWFIDAGTMIRWYKLDKDMSLTTVIENSLSASDWGAAVNINASLGHFTEQGTRNWLGDEEFWGLGDYTYDGNESNFSLLLSDTSLVTGDTYRWSWAQDVVNPTRTNLLIGGVEVSTSEDTGHFTGITTAASTQQALQTGSQQTAGTLVSGISVRHLIEVP